MNVEMIFFFTYKYIMQIRKPVIIPFGVKYKVYVILNYHK